MDKPLSELEKLCLEELGKRPGEFVSGSQVGLALKKSLLIDGVINALVGLALRDLAEQHERMVWKFRISESGQRWLEDYQAQEGIR